MIAYRVYNHNERYYSTEKQDSVFKSGVKYKCEKKVEVIPLIV